MAILSAHEIRRHFALAPDLVFLDHGAFGACPVPVLEAQGELRARMERDPIQFLARELEGLLDEARSALAPVIAARPQDVVFVNNATTAVNAVLRSLPLAPGDEVLTTSHAYNACANALGWVAERAGAKVVVAQVPFPLRDPGEVVESILSCATPRTRLALLDHVTSPTGLVWPIGQIAPRLEERGIRTLVDGAHGIGMLPLDVPALGASYYTSNCHKWLCAPKGAALLWVRPDRQDGLVPATISHGLNRWRAERGRFHELFDWTGTDDPTAALATPYALRFLAGLDADGLDGVMRRNRAQVLRGRDLLARALGVTPPAPDDMIATLATLALPPDTGAPPKSPFDLDPVQEALYRRHRIEVRILSFPRHPARLLRISAHVYNHDAEYELLARALAAELG